LREECWLRVSENRVLRRILGSERKTVREEWRRLYHKEFYALHSSQDIIRAIRSRRLRWARYVARMSKSTSRILVEKPEERW
jgi:hypothetical protein